MRCDVCGRLSAEGCCERCHSVHDRSWKEYRSSSRRLLIDAKALRQKRIAQGLTQEQVAGLIGVNVNAFQNWDTGRYRPPEEMQVAWRNVLA